MRMIVSPFTSYAAPFPSKDKTPCTEISSPDNPICQLTLKSVHDDDVTLDCQKCMHVLDDRLSFVAKATVGCRKRMEDDFAMGPLSFLGCNAHAFSVFDGHGGALAANYCANNLLAVLDDVQVHTKTELMMDKTEAGKGLIEKTVMTLDALFSEKYPDAANNMGSTALIVVVDDKYIWHGHCGDSRAVLCRNGIAVDISSDHDLCNKAERDRIQNAGGFIWCDHEDETENQKKVCRRIGSCFGLNMSRAIGDKDYDGLVIPDPDTSVTVRSPHDEFIILASDGLWSVMESADAVKLVRNHLRKNKPVHLVADALVREAECRCSSDNITVVVIVL